MIKCRDKLVNFQSLGVLGLMASALWALNVQAQVYQIDIDHFDPKVMEKILREHGTFEVVGDRVEKLREQANSALDLAREILNLPMKELEQVKQERFHGFQNVREETFAKNQANPKFPVRNQIAFHFKPYLEFGGIPKKPNGVANLEAYDEYYKAGTAFLDDLYVLIAKSFIDQKLWTKDDPNDLTNVLTSRKYFFMPDGDTGIPAHSDYGLLTLVVSDRNGLEVLEGENTKVGKWLQADFGAPKKPRFFVNVGDWLLFQTGNRSFVAGVHRVPKTEGDRFSLALFKNPPLGEKVRSFKDVELDYKTFLFSYKTAHHSNARLD